MVGNKIRDVTHIPLAEGSDKGIEILLGAESRIQLVKTHDVDGVSGSSAGAIERRSINVADPELLQVRNNLRRILKREVAAELQPVSCRWNSGFSSHRSLSPPSLMRAPGTRSFRAGSKKKPLFSDRKNLFVRRHIRGRWTKVKISRGDPRPVARSV